MILIDTNVLVYAHREDAHRHRDYRHWLESILNGDAAYGLSELVLSSFLRIVTHPKIFTRPTPIDTALQFTTQLREPTHCTIVTPGARHWELFARLCHAIEVKGNLIPDAYLAALAIESGCEWITTDRDFSRFPDLRWRHPLA